MLDKFFFNLSLLHRTHTSSRSRGCGSSWVPRLPVQHLVNQPTIHKHVTCHHHIDAPSVAIGFEVLPLHPVLDEILSSGAVLVYASNRGDVICGYAIAKREQAIRVVQAMWSRGTH